MNNYIMCLFYFIVTIFLLLQIIKIYKYEKFEESITPKRFTNNNIHSIILSPIDQRSIDDINNEIDNKINVYYGTYISDQSNIKSDDSINSLDIYKAVDSFQGSYNWIQQNNKLDDTIIITDITYNDKQHMVAIGLYYTSDPNDLKNKIANYCFYVKTSTDVNSKWGEKIIPNIPIRSLCYDIKTSKLLGINSYDGQIYENIVEGIITPLTNWVGPINQDSPMKKIMYDKYENMIGIGLFDNYIYIKKTNNWRKSYWDKKNINRTKVYDLIYDYDGCLIATSPKGILKQLKPELSSTFENYKTYNRWNNKYKEVLSQNDILKYKIGYDIMSNNDLFTDIEGVYAPLTKRLESIYNIKKMALNLCASKKYRRNIYRLNKNDESYKYREIGELYEKIEEINYKMNKKI